MLVLWCVVAPLAESRAHARTATLVAGERVTPNPPTESLDLRDFGAVGDGVTDDGPALQSALDALAAAGGGTLFVPAARYAIITPVLKNFAGLASSVTIVGVASSTPVAPPTSPGNELTRGLDLVSEFAPKTGSQNAAIAITGLTELVVEHLVFIGTPDVTNDALITLNLREIEMATIRHCEFYGLSSLVEGGTIVQAVRSHLTVEQTVFLGSTASSGVYSPLIQNLEWKGFVINNSIFADYGQRAEQYGKMGYGSPFSWINIGNAAALTPDSPRREATFREVFIDEGGFVGISSLPNLYQPSTAPIDLIYISGLFANVSNLGTTGLLLYDAKNVVVEKSHFGYSTNADSAIQLNNVNNAILDQVECVANADTIRTDAATGKLTVINSIYNNLDSQAQVTNVLTVAPEDDPIIDVRQRFFEQLGHAPDAAAHFYWSDQQLQCNQDSECVSAIRFDLDEYLGLDPQAKFFVSGRVVDEDEVGLGGVTVALSGSQNLSIQTNSEGEYYFSGLPSSGQYSVTPTLLHHSITPGNFTVTTPTSDQSCDFAVSLNHHDISGRVLDAAGNSLGGVTVTLSGSESSTVTTNDEGEYSFANLPADGNYTILPTKTSYSFAPSSMIFQTLSSDQLLHFTGSFVTYTLSGIVVDVNNGGMGGVQLRLSGSQTATTTSDGSGTFSFANIPSEGNYTIEPFLKGFAFTPASETYNSLSENKFVAFSGASSFHTISGRITNANNNGVPGVLVTLSGAQSGSFLTDQTGNYAFPNLPADEDFMITPSLAGYTFNPSSAVFSDLAGNQSTEFELIVPTPLLITLENGTAAAALTSVTWLQDPFSVASTDSFSPDQRTRIMLFAMNLKLQPGENSSAVTVQMEDAQQRIYNLPVEYVGQVPGLDWMTQLIVKLTDEVANVGDCQTSIVYHGKVSNKALVKLKL